MKALESAHIQYKINNKKPFFKAIFHELFFPLFMSIFLSLIIVTVFDIFISKNYSIGVGSEEWNDLNFYFSLFVLITTYLTFSYRANKRNFVICVISSVNFGRLDALFFSLIFGLVVFLVASLLEYASGGSLITPASTDHASAIKIFSKIATYGLLIPYIEEFLFRGTLMNLLLERYSARASISACALIFTICHSYVLLGGFPYVVGLLSIGVLGVVTSSLRVKYGKISYPLAVHFVYNSLCYLF